MTQLNPDELRARLEAAAGTVVSQGKTPVAPPVQETVKVESKPEIKVETPKAEPQAPVPPVAPARPVPGQFISDEFSALQQSLAVAAGDAEPPSVSAKDILGGIKIDLNAIEINNGATEIDLMANQNAVLSSKKVMQVVACQSSYSAEISALKNQEIQNISGANVDFYNQMKRLYRALWSHIENTSVGKMDFATWMKVTSYFDVETLLYGAYCQTFPYENKYSLRCPKPDCNTPFEVTVNNNTLVETRGQDEEIFAKINEIISNVKNANELVKNSLVHTDKRIAADESKIVFDVHIPSVFDYLEGILSNVNEEYAQEYQTSLGIALFIKQALIPDIVNFQRTGELKYIPIEDKGKIIELIANLPYYDGLQIADEIQSFTERYRIEYSIKKASCPSCGHVIDNIPMSMEEVLFIAIRQGRRESNE
jgi:hypothetical protein